MAEIRDCRLIENRVFFVIPTKPKRFVWVRGGIPFYSIIKGFLDGHADGVTARNDNKGH
jgi:hypothetical protein